MMQHHRLYLSIDVQMLRRCVNIFVAPSTQVDDNFCSRGNSWTQLLQSTKYSTKQEAAVHFEQDITLLSLLI